MSTFDLQSYYPKFVPNQLLTSTQLNSLREYLDQQDRLSRIRLTGTGIVCGLQGKIDANKNVVITGGFGLTSYGYIIELKGSTYKWYREYTDPLVKEEGATSYPEYLPWRTDSQPYAQISLWELLDDEIINNENTGQTYNMVNAGFLSKKALVLYLEFKEEDLSSCLVTDCNNKGINIRQKARVLLIKQSDLDKITKCPAPETNIMVPQLIAALKKNGVDGLESLNTAAQLNAAYKKAAQQISYQVTSAIQNVYSQYRDLLRLDESADADMTALSTLVSAIYNQTNFNQYHYDFFNDLAAAYNEFVRQLCPLVKNCSPEGDFPRHLVLRDFGVTTGANRDSGDYRTVFMPSPVRDAFYSQVEKTKNLFVRILDLVKNFNSSTNNVIKITPSHTEEAPLGSRALPFYYTYGDKFWQPKECCTTEPLLSYHTNEMKVSPTWPGDLTYEKNPLYLNNNSFPFYRIEGHLNNTAESALKILEDYRKQFNLEFELLRFNTKINQTNDTDPELLQIDELLAQITVNEKAIDNLINNPTSTATQDIQDLLSEIWAFRKSIVEINKKWQEKRLKLKAPCSITNLQEDYLLLRSEALCCCSKVQAILAAIPDFSPKPSKNAGVTFESVAAGQQYGQKDGNSPGEVIFTEENIPVSVENFTRADGNTAFSTARVEEISTTDTGHIMRTNNISLRFDFTELDFVPEIVTFEFKHTGGNENISVNDEQLIIGHLDSAPAAIADGVTFSVAVQSVSGGITGKVTLVGKVKSLLTGGEEFWIDNIVASATDTVNGGISVRKLKARSKKDKLEIDSINARIKKAATDLEKRELLLQKENLTRRLANADRVGTIAETGLNINKMMVSKIAGLDASAYANVQGVQVRMEAEADNPLAFLLLGLYFGVVRITYLMDDVCLQFPKDARAFNYPLFSYSCKNLINLLIQLRMLVNFLIEVLLAALYTTPSLMKYMQAELMNAVVKIMPRLMDYMNAYNSIFYTCLPARLSTLYYTLQYTLNKKISFAEFAAKNPGMVHLAGVKKGGSFILLSEEKNGQEIVMADFSLSNRVQCCCDIIPDEICYPPLAMPEYRVIERNIGDAGNVTIDEVFDVIRNDINLNASASLKILIPSQVSLLGGTLAIENSTELGRDVIRYSIDIRNTYAIDYFSYTLTDETCGVKDNGEVHIFIKQKLPDTVSAYEDIAVTSMNNAVDIDVAMNDVFSNLSTSGNYQLSVSYQPSSAGHVDVITGQNGRRLLRFTPATDYIGRDIFTYTIKVGNMTSEGMVTVLVIPCCQQPSPGLIVVGPTFTGIVHAGGVPLPGVVVMIKGTTLGTTTDMNGSFQLGDLSLGSNTLVFNSVGYAVKELTIMVQAGGPNKLPAVIDLEAETIASSPKLSIRESELTVLAGKVTGDTSTDQAKEAVTGLYQKRYKTNTADLKKIKDRASVTDERALSSAQLFVSNYVNDMDISADEIGIAYEKTIDTLLVSYNAAPQSEKSAYSQLISISTRAYLDRITITEPGKLSVDTKNTLVRTTEKLEENKIASAEILNDWKSSDISDQMKIKVLNEITSVLK